jgi:hypothetical protein
MNRSILIAFAVLVALPTLTQAKPQTYNVLVAGGSEQHLIRISLVTDGRAYVIDSLVPLEVGGTVCANSEGMPNQLICQASLVGSFEVNSGAGDDVVWIARDVPVPVTLRGGSGNDLLGGGASSDRLLGGPGEDRLVGRSGADGVYGGSGADRLIGGRGEDACNGGPGEDVLNSCEMRKP